MGLPAYSPLVAPGHDFLLLLPCPPPSRARTSPIPPLNSLFQSSEVTVSELRSRLGASESAAEELRGAQKTAQKRMNALEANNESLLQQASAAQSKANTLVEENAVRLVASCSWALYGCLSVLPHPSPCCCIIPVISLLFTLLVCV